jgi:TatD DNase family protein
VIDTHAHLDACVDPPEELLARARAAGVHRVIAIGSGIDSCRSTLTVADRVSGVSCALGIHPHQAGGREAGRLDELEGLLASEHVVAVGETGLDYFRGYAPRTTQRRVFAEQLDLASRLNLAVVIHSRAAEGDTLAVLQGFVRPVVLHCFSSPELAEPALERGYYLSFAGNVTYPGASALRDVVAHVPSDRILVETDCPYLSPQAVRGRPNEPANVIHTLATIAAVRGCDVREAENQVETNARVAFGLS